MTRWICDDCLQEIEADRKPTGCPACGNGPRILRIEDEPERPTCGLCGRTVAALAPGRTICENCAHFPLD